MSSTTVRCGTWAASILVASLALASLPACSVAFVDSPRTAGLGCTDSKFYPYLDYLLAIGLTAAMIGYDTVSDAPAALTVPGAFALSGLWGSHKVGQCRERLAHATPADWDAYARAREQQQRDAEERQRRYEQLQQQLQSTPPPAPSGYTTDTTGGETTDTSGGEAPPSAPPVPSGTKTLTINGTTYTDRADGELGNACGVDNNTCTSPAYACQLITSTSGVCVPSR